MSETNKDILKFDAEDGKLHIYFCAAYYGRRWVGSLALNEDKMNTKDFEHQGNFLVAATIRSLVKNKIISA